MIRSAKMNAMTPPKEMPPFHSAAARGTLPMEQTKLMMAMNGPTTAFSRLVQKPCPRDEDRLPHRCRHQDGQEAGDHVADDQLAPQHGQVGHGVGGAVGPTGTRAQPCRQAARSSASAVGGAAFA